MSDFTIANQRDLDALARGGYKLTPATLGHKIFGGAWVPTKHLMYISAKIAHAIAKGKGRLIISVPPRHGKSELGSVNTPIWFLEKWPSKKVVLSSYGAELSTDFSRRVRDTFTDPNTQQFLNTRLKSDAQQVAKFLTTENGACYAVGIGGPITGRGGHVFILDDYIKNNEDAFSEATREKAWNWLISTAFSRREPGCTFIIIATRWHRDDIIGRLLEEFPTVFDYIKLPAIAEDDDPVGRKVGEALWPERYDLEELDEIKMLSGNYWWKAMYQQDPPASMSSADIGKCLKFIDAHELPHYASLKWVRAWDLAGTEGGGDWTSGIKMAYSKTLDMTFLVDLSRGQNSPAKVEHRVQTAAFNDGPSVPIEIEQEPGSAGKSLIAHYQRTVLPGYSVTGTHPTGPPEVRAMPFIGACESGKVTVVRGTWNEKFISELEAFPDGTHDDQISSAALGYDRLMRGRFGSPVWGRTDSGLYVPKGNQGDKRKSYTTGVVW